MFYSLIFVILSIFSICGVFSYKKSEIYFSNVLFYFVIFSFIMIGGFRFETGGDWPGYKAMYDGINDGRVFVEPLFLCIIKVAKFLGHYQWIFFFCELVRFLTMAVFLEKVPLDRRYKCLFVLLYYVMYFFYYDLVIIRQSTAVAVFIFGILKNNRLSFKKYVIYVFLATCFHFSSLFLLFLYHPLVQMRGKKVALITFLFIAFYFLGLDIIPMALESILKTLPSNFLFDRLYAYTQIETLAYSRKITGQSLVYLFIFFLALFDRYILKKQGNSLYFNGLCLFMFLYFGFPSLSAISTRLSTYFSVFVIFTLIEIIHIYRKTVIIPLGIVILCFCFNKSIFFEAPSHAAYNPYQFFWVNEIFDIQSDGALRLEKTGQATMKIRED